MTSSQIIQRLGDIYRAKNHDYGNTAHRTFVEFGEVALVVRISDKLSRLTSLIGQKAQVKTESVIDTIGDAITYLCMLAAEIEWANTIPDDMTEEEKIAMTSNYDLTLAYLASLRDIDRVNAVLPEDKAYYRLTLIAIWKDITDPEIRKEEYIFLAAQLLEEYKRRTT